MCNAASNGGRIVADASTVSDAILELTGSNVRDIARLQSPMTAPMTPSAQDDWLSCHSIPVHIAATCGQLGAVVSKSRRSSQTPRATVDHPDLSIAMQPLNGRGKDNR